MKRRSFFKMFANLAMVGAIGVKSHWVHEVWYPRLTANQLMVFPPNVAVVIISGPRRQSKCSQ